MAGIISLWSGPRNISTALMYSFSRRSDMTVVDEPLYAHYLLKSGAEHPGREEVIATMESDPLIIWEKCREKTGEGYVFLKNMAHHAIDLPEEWYDQPIALFLIRDPHDMLPSLGKVLTQPSLADTGLEKQVRMINRMKESGKEVLVVEGADILRDPPGMLGKLCNCLGIPFEQDMLTWPAGPIPEDGIWARYWYDQVHGSTGFNAWKPPKTSVPDKLQPLLETCLPFYNELKSLKIKPE